MDEFNPSNVLLKNELFLRKHDCKISSAHRSTYFFLYHKSLTYGLYNSSIFHLAKSRFI